MKTHYYSSLGFVLVLALGLSAMESRADIVSRSAAIKDVKAVEIHGHHKLTLTQGNEESLSYSADEEWIEEVVVENRNGTLILKLKDKNSKNGWNWGSSNDDREVAFTLHVKDLRKIVSHGASQIDMGDFKTDKSLEIASHGASRINAKNISAEDLQVKLHGASKFEVDDIAVDDLDVVTHGAGNVVFRDITADEADITMHGAGDVNFTGKGKLNELEIRVHGAGNVEAKDVVVQRADIGLHGAGRATVNVESNLDVAVHGAGSVRYYGKPNVDLNTHGSGSVKAAE